MKAKKIKKLFKNQSKTLKELTVQLFYKKLIIKKVRLVFYICIKQFEIAFTTKFLLNTKSGMESK